MTDERKIDDGGPAFPCPLGDSCEWHHGQSGMSYRQWLAGMVMQGLLAGGGYWETRNLAVESVQYADELILTLKGGAT